MTTHNNKHKTAHTAHATHAAQKPAGQPSAPAHETHKAGVAAAPKTNTNMQMVLVAVLVIAAFFGAYRFARASNSAGASPSAGIAGAATQAGSVLGAAVSGAGSGGCCGSGGGAPVEGAATVEGDVQKISVDLSTGSYNPNVIKLKAGVPAEITFGQSSGCTAIVQSQDLGFQEDLSSGPKTVKLEGLAAGTYGFACGMNMVQGTIVVQ